jgi:hypothetical protein
MCNDPNEELKGPKKMKEEEEEEEEESLTPVRR